MLLSLLPSQRILHNFCCSHNLDEQTGKLVVGASSWLLMSETNTEMPGELVNVVSCLFMMESGEEEITVVALLLVSRSVSLCSWQSQRENSPSLRCELSKCDDLSENVCVHITFVLCSWEHGLHNPLVTPLSCCSCPRFPSWVSCSLSIHSHESYLWLECAYLWCWDKSELVWCFREGQ